MINASASPDRFAQATWVIATVTIDKVRVRAGSELVSATVDMSGREGGTGDLLHANHLLPRPGGVGMKATVAEGREVGTQLPSLTVRFHSGSGWFGYAGAPTDFNPIHYSEHFAKQAGLPGVIAHGLFTMGTALRGHQLGWRSEPGHLLLRQVSQTGGGT